MAVTSVYNLRYQSLSDAPNGATLGQNLAEDVESELVRLDAALGSPTGSNVSVPGNLTVGGNLAVGGIGSRVTKFKAIDEPVANTAFQNDDHLFWTVAAGATYALEMNLFTVGASGAGAGGVGEIGLQMTKPSLCRLDLAVISPAWNTASGVIGSVNFQGFNNDTGTTSGQVLLGTDVGLQLAIVRAFVRVAGTGGTLQLQWAQWVTNATPSKLLSGSWGTLERVA